MVLLDRRTLLQGGLQLAAVGLGGRAGRSCLVAAQTGGGTAARSGTVRKRFVCRLENGELLEGDQLANWDHAQATPRLGSKYLDGPNGRRWRWIRDFQNLPLATPPAYVEMHFGDRLPGRVLGLVRERGELLWGVAPDIELRAPGQKGRQIVRVPAGQVRRIVWQATGNGYQPGLVVARDGRAWRARAIDPDQRSVRFITGEAVEQIPYAELAELHWPSSDPWDSYRHWLARGNRQLASPMWHWATSDGLRLTAAASTFAVSSSSKSWKPEQWVHGLHPVWSDQPLWVRCHTLGWRHAFAADQVPLTLVPPVAGSLGPWQVDGNPRGGLLSCERQMAGWGWGVLAPSRLEIPLPVEAESLRLSYGFDHLAGRHGLVQARIEWRGPEATSDPASGNLLDTGPVAAASASRQESTYDLAADKLPEASRLVFEVDDLALVDQPLPGAEADVAAGAPGNIGDFWDWIEPQLQLNRQQLNGRL